MFRGSVWLYVCAFVIFGIGVPHGRAQSYPVAEGYIGFTVLNNEYGTDRHNSPGVVLNFGYNATRNVRLLADLGFEAHDTNIIWANGRSASANDYQLLFGPELTLRANPKVTPFMHGLVGLAVRSYAVPNGNWICTGYSCYEDSFSVARETGFASGIGGGVDWNFHPIVSLRIVQFDWIRTHLSRDNLNFSPITGQLPTLSGWQDNYRFSCGFNFRFGEKGASK